MKYDETVTLSNGVVMPRVGLGTFKASGAQVIQAVQWAVEAGYKHIDTASIYKNEAEIAQALKAAGGREKVFITTKVSPYEHGYDKAMKAMEESLIRLETDCVDCILIHWPGVVRTPADSEKNRLMRAETWEALEELYKTGKTRAIGVSNYSIAHLEELLSHCTVPPMVNQVEIHPRLSQATLRQRCLELNIALVAYSPLGKGDLTIHSTITRLAKKHQRTSAQILLRWGLQNGVSVIPKSTSKEHIFSNHQLDDFDLDSDDMAALSQLDDGHHYCWNAEEIL